MQCSETPALSRAEERRQHLLRVSQSLFIENGFHGTGVAQIAAASGVRVGQIYRDFSSKEDIVAAIVEADLASFLNEQELRTAVADRDRAALRRWMSAFLDVGEATEDDRLLPEIVAEAGRNPRIAQIMRTLDDRIRDSLMLALTVLLEGTDPEQKRAETLAEFILTFGIGMCNRRLIAPSPALDNVVQMTWAAVERELDDITETA